MATNCPSREKGQWKVAESERSDLPKKKNKKKMYLPERNVGVFKSFPHLCLPQHNVKIYWNSSLNSTHSSTTSDGMFKSVFQLYMYLPEHNVDGVQIRPSTVLIWAHCVNVTRYSNPSLNCTCLSTMSDGIHIRLTTLLIWAQRQIYLTFVSNLFLPEHYVRQNWHPPLHSTYLDTT